MRTINWIAAPCALGAPESGPEAAPGVLMAAGIPEFLRHSGLPLVTTQAPPPPAGTKQPALQAFNTCLAELTRQAVNDHQFVITLGGDHSLAAGSWKGVGSALGGPPGLIWIDAHLDAHTPETSPTGNPHGMPLAALLGHGADWLTGIFGPALDPRRVVVIGARSYEQAELERLNALQVRIIGGKTLGKLGMKSAMALAVDLMGKAPWGVSLDIDVLDPHEAPGVSTPAPNGLSISVLCEALRGLFFNPLCVGMDIVEFNPRCDQNNLTLDVVRKLLVAVTTRQVE